MLVAQQEAGDESAIWYGDDSSQEEMQRWTGTHV